MALAETPKTGLRPSRHFAIRLAGLTGIFVAAVGLVVTATASKEIGWALTAGGAIVALIGVVTEIKQGVGRIAGRRSAFGTNVALQIALAIVLLVGVNLFSFGNYRRFDWTRDGYFTLSDTVRDQMGRLRGETTIVLYQRHKTFGQLSDKPDMYDYAAERKVVEKVRDLVDQFRELGRQFRVVVLDVEEEGYNEKLAELTEQSKPLREAIDSASENSIFFYSDGKVQHLGFHDVYELDKQASQGADGGRGNLVLLYQGVDPFARKILNIDEKRPRIGVAVIHEVLSTEGSEELGMVGMRKALAARGFDTRDLILKKWSEFAGPEPAVFTYDESKYERLEEELAEVDAAVKSLEQELQEFGNLVNYWKTATLEDLTKKYADQLQGQKISEALRTRQVAYLQQNVALREFLLSQQREERDAVAKEKVGLNVEDLMEQRRIADLRAKADRMLADCDLLILPRMTQFNVARGEMIPNRLYRLDDAQVEAIKDFLKAGKPVLALLGPVGEPATSRFESLGEKGPDKVEEALEQLGIRLSKQTVLFNVESKSFAERRGGLLVLGANVDVPPVEFTWPAGAEQPPGRPIKAEAEKPNPIRESMALTARSLGQGQTLDLRIRHPRPIYYQPPPGQSEAFDPVFMMSAPASWNEEQPFPSRGRTPRFEPPKSDDPTKGTLDEKRRGPFPIGVAAETTVPADWYPNKDAKPATVRVAVIGHGGVFIGNTLPAVKEKLLLDVCNWLLGRDDLLAKAEHRWQYPRVTLGDSQQALWQWGIRLGLPLLFAYLGLVVLMVRRLR
jgi:ABC-type uncharacterized transport system